MCDNLGRGDLEMSNDRGEKISRRNWRMVGETTDGNGNRLSLIHIWCGLAAS